MKYDAIISLGELCATASALKEAKITSETYPFDWSGGVKWEKCGICGFKGKIDLICNDFQNAFNLSDFSEFHGIEPRTRSILNKKTGLQYTHDFPWNKSIAEYYHEFIQKYNRRVKRLYDKIYCSKNILFVFVTRFKHCFPLEEFDEAYQKLAEKFPQTNIDFLILQDSHDMKEDETYVFYEKKHIKFVLFNDFENKNEIGNGNRLIITKQIAKHANMNYFQFNADNIPCYGLSLKESWGRWSCASQVILKIKTDFPHQNLELNFKMIPYINDYRTYQKSDIYINNKKLATWKWEKNINPETIIFVPKTLNTQNILEIRFDIDNPVSPKETGLNEDSRTIALGFIQLLIKNL